MGIFFSKATKAVIDKNRVATSYFITGACFLLIAANVAVFLFIPKIMLPLAVVLSNAVTVILMLLAVQPINNLIQREFAKRQASSWNSSRRNRPSRTVWWNWNT